MTGQRALAWGVGLSALVHGLVLGMGWQTVGLKSEPPRLIEARLLRDTPPVMPPEHAMPPQGHPAEVHPAQAAPRNVRSPTPAHRAAVQDMPQTLAPAVLTASAPAPTSAPVYAAAAPGPAPAASAPVATAASQPYSPPSFGAAYLDNPKPGYPLMAKRRGLEGIVRLDVRVSSDGLPLSVRIKEGSGHEVLDDAAVTAVSHWRFVPARRGAESIEASVVVPIRFQLARDEAG